MALLLTSLSIHSESGERSPSYRWRREKQTEREFFAITGRMMWKASSSPAITPRKQQLHDEQVRPFRA
jgi:hypothetical protein